MRRLLIALTLGFMVLCFVKGASQADAGRSSENSLLEAVELTLHKRIKDLLPS